MGHYCTLINKKLGVCWGSAMLAGKMAGYCTKLFNENCWADQTSFIAKGDPYDEFTIHPSFRFIEKELEELLERDDASRADMAVALKRLETEVENHKRTSEALRDSEVLFRGLFESTNDAIFIHDGPTFIDCNPAALSIMAATDKNQIIGHTPLDFALHNPRDPRPLEEISREKIEAAMRGESPLFEWPVRRLDGARIFLETKLMLVKWHDETRIQAVCRDITERIQAEEERFLLEKKLQQSQKIEAIGTLAGGIAHDFNNLLGVILGYSEMAQEQVVEGSQLYDDIDTVIVAGNRARDLVTQILTFSRQTKSEQIRLNPQPVIKEALKLLRSSIPTTIKIVHDIDSRNCMIKADPTQFHQIIINLCSNSYQAMEEGGGILTVKLDQVELEKQDILDEPALKTGPYVRLTIADTGPGIDPETLKHVFDPFFTTKEVGQGTGLGLAVVHGIVKKHNGMVRIQSTPDEGTNIEVFFPKLADEPGDKVSNPDPIFGGHERILFIDDEQLLAEMGEQLLQRLGYTVTSLTSSAEAFKIFQTDPDKFDLVITDQTMPELTGTMLAEKMLAIRPDLPIILCTGYSNIISEQEALDMGMRAFVMKPMTKKDIAPLIREILEGTIEN